MMAGMSTREPIHEAERLPALREAFAIARHYPLACFAPAVLFGLIIQLSHLIHADHWITGLIVSGTGIFAFTLYLAYVEEVALEAEAGVDRIGVRHAIRLMRRTGPVLFAVAIATGIALFTVSIGLFAALFGVWLLTRWSLVVPLIARRRLGPTAALRQSNALVRGAFWPVFFTATLAIIVEQAMTSVFPYLVDPGAGGWGRWLLGAAVTSLVMPISGLVVSASYNRRAEGALPKLV
jgi:hypothetical protein